ncbi:MAG: nitrilase family protein [Muribaculaceae bacterium]|nr:nitrilase family protein [Muribaculaceae bacterium]
MPECQQLNIAILPLDIVPGDPRANMDATREGVTKAAAERADVVALPELFSTGFITDPEQLAIFAEEGERIVSELADMAALYGVVITGSCLNTDAKHLVNQGFIILPDGCRVTYNKRHLFCLSPEHELIKAGGELPPVIDYKGWRLSIIVCYDLRFPAWCRNTGNRYDVMFVPANWPKVRQYAWEHLIIARAIENQAYVVGANRSGEDRFGSYTDSSLIVDPLGYPISKPAAWGLMVSMSYEKLSSSRAKLPAQRDADRILFPDIDPASC